MFAICLITPLSLITLFAREQLASYITNEEEVRDTVSNMFILVAIVLVFDSGQVFMQGPILAMGFQTTACYYSIACYWLIGLPLAYYFSYLQGFGAFGLYAGICIANLF